MLRGARRLHPDGFLSARRGAGRGGWVCDGVALDPRAPVLVGAGAVQQRCDDPAGALEPVELMIAALERAGVDSGAPDLLRRASQVRIPRGFWGYADPGRIIAARLGCTGARTQVAELGVLQSTLLGDAARAIAAGEADVVLIAGGEARYRALRAEITRGAAPLTEQPPGTEPDEVLRPHGDILSMAEIEIGLAMPVAQYAVIENALYAADGLDRARGRARTAELCARFSAVAASNPQAWTRDPVDASAIAIPSGGNRMLALPYTKWHTSQWNVDQAAGLILCSVAAARQAGVPEDRWVFPLAATESNLMRPLSARAELHRSPGFQIAGERAVAVAGVAAGDVEHVELYSCFPSAVQVQARELGLSLGRPLTLTGGMTFAGGPLNSFVLQAMCRLVEVLREHPGERGLLTAISGMITKQGVTLWSTRPAEGGFRFEDVTAAVERVSGAPLDVDQAYEGPARVVSYTVLHEGGAPARGIVVCDVAPGRRAIAASTDASVLAAMVEEEMCGRAVELRRGGVLVRLGGS